MTSKEAQGWQLPLMQFVTLMLMTLLLVALGHFARTMVDNYRLNTEKAMWEARIEQEREAHARLLEQKAFVASDSYQRHLAHEMGLYAPDERPLVLLVPPEMADEVEQFDPIYREGTVVEPPYWQQWWALFFGP